MEASANQGKPLLLVDIDGVLSIFGWRADDRPAGSFLTVDGIAHYLSAEAATHLLQLARRFDLVWCSGWEDKADDYLPAALGLPGGLPHISFDQTPGHAGAHWKLRAIDLHAGENRPVAWIDDAHTPDCREWASARPGPTLLVTTDPARGLQADHAAQLEAWADSLATRPRREPRGA